MDDTFGRQDEVELPPRTSLARQHVCCPGTSPATINHLESPAEEDANDQEMKNKKVEI
jgi:hypothetical protein